MAKPAVALAKAGACARDWTWDPVIISDVLYHWATHALNLPEVYQKPQILTILHKYIIINAQITEQAVGMLMISETKFKILA